MGRDEQYEPEGNYVNEGARDDSYGNRGDGKPEFVLEAAHGSSARDPYYFPPIPGVNANRPLPQAARVEPDLEMQLQLERERKEKRRRLWVCCYSRNLAVLILTMECHCTSIYSVI